MVGLGEDLGWQPLGRLEQPLALPARADERPDDIVDVAPARLPHQALFLREVPVRHLADPVHRFA